MKRCPNCGHLLKIDESVCTYCGYTFSKEAEQNKAEFTKVKQGMSRSQIQKENSTNLMNTVSKLPLKEIFQKMLLWIHKNSTIVFVTGLILMVFTSIVPELGWTCLLLLLGWLFWVCKRDTPVKQYTVDKQLTADLNKTGERFGERADRQRERIINEHPEVEEKVRKVKQFRLPKSASVYRWGAILTSLISLFIFFSKSENTNSLSRTILTFANNQFSSSQTIFAVLVYIGWVYIVITPFLIIYRLLKNQTVRAFVFALVETILLLGLIIYSSRTTAISTFGSLTKQLISTLTAIAVNYYLLIFTSVLTTVLTLINLIKDKKDI
ncbi:zinc ribbon domain-containing protein [Lactobacillus jensenii]|jgi:hypothetical protein|uniref:Zinc ribbon domain-containing protein n=1 Tax=Lactobacillus jensenii TaxID=109790 RepID=A0A5N1IJA1_LACJE|nr:zinc ribbon domain-containing protein [Lactobacillus jensenii]APT15216.1 zinc ribbon domain-containing protein [Lactobacillus jensenii]EEQ24179.1 hypothetical protein LACJE0001_1499 [Lactobacillus jensenii 269-3]KAA9234595.1 zinc ribbon domain-containing protein [Lactobacillus jensenii]KAA9257827.1 zinc ribbon domain-containing protein [Lactobacillus jensenii]KAA9264463.1 zinc ribbon domain-containing protein [Lactobacillus jensenii]